VSRDLPSMLVHGTLASVTSRLSPALHPRHHPRRSPAGGSPAYPRGIGTMVWVVVSQRVPAASSSEGASFPSNQFPTASRKKAYTDLPC
jgi:hypothetical protein